MLREAALLTQLLLVAAEPPSADDDVPVSKLIPPDVPGASDQSAPPPSAPSPKALRGRATLEGVGTVASAARSLVVPYPTPAPPLWQGRLSLDLSGRWSASSRLSVTASDRVNVLTQDGTAVTAQSAFQNDLREAYVTWEALEGVFAEVGRENLRHGVALGFNPTDFFRAGSLVGQASLDPSVRRQNRLGTAMVRAQALWSGGAASVTYSPKLFKAPPLAATDRLGVNPRLDATNSVHRILCALNLEVADLSPELLAYLEPGQARFGLSLTRPLGESVIAYGEWAGDGKRISSRGRLRGGASMESFRPIRRCSPRRPMLLPSGTTWPSALLGPTPPLASRSASSTTCTRAASPIPIGASGSIPPRWFRVSPKKRFGISSGMCVVSPATNSSLLLRRRRFFEPRGIGPLWRSCTYPVLLRSISSMDRRLRS